ncbi:flagellar hook-basal body complex protein FliE [Sporomusa sp.]|jgi:flagellar hook-basal body complex protein FliE|uniref:flagellar hook-basal body complex protein FliE n=1 Tax=Sporomusa sp. TaxID=2078658 RepID=UPI00297A3A48|nr:flagellar hook-basal body complex protein FliE [Sporomusa sp.]MDF2571009.1 fliE [Sporomusa sp.]MDF2875099.1 fliE [Sporomusa sp.]HWR05351.1 flagellar hook-basal body complex protein FliE [Sporomusa sp.]
MKIEALKMLPVKGTLTGTSAVDSSQQPEKAFGEYLKDALTSVNNLQGESRQASLNLAAGKIEDVAEVTIAAEKASIALQLTMQVRNKVVDAYQEVMRMQV